MAVFSTTAHDPDQMQALRGPIRTCIGCRKRVAATELLRVVVAPGTSEQAAVVVDPRHRAPGRGAWLHRDPGCVDLAERRRAFGRALRVPEPLDSTAVREYVAATCNPTGGNPQE